MSESKIEQLSIMMKRAAVRGFYFTRTASTLQGHFHSVKLLATLTFHAVIPKHVEVSLCETVFLSNTWENNKLLIINSCNSFESAINI